MPGLSKDLQGIFRSAVSNANLRSKWLCSNGKKHERFLVSDCVPRYAPAPNLLLIGCRSAKLTMQAYF